MGLVRELSADDAKALQIYLNRFGYKTKVDADPGPVTLSLYHDLLKKIGLPETDELTDLAMEKIREHFVAISLPTAPEVSEPTPKMPADPQSRPQWLLYLDARIGWSEFTHDKQLGALWKKHTNLTAFTSVIGSSNAWCAMIACAALETSGLKSPHNGLASKFNGFGIEIDFEKDGIPAGAHIHLRHINEDGSLGGNHITFADRDHLPGEKSFDGLGGNQDNKIQVVKYLRSKHKIMYVGWAGPKKPGRVTVAGKSRAGTSSGSTR